MQATWGLGYRQVEFEGDNLILNNILHGKGQNWRGMFTDVVFQFRHREANFCADILAKKAVSSDLPWSLYHSCPLFLQPYVNNDMVF
ncbi:hypothetical protein EUTSA_v10024083mg [Eutrema salsugineum]|uniref:Uncharacterized protein n=1 Tax=Eutrema salsugineum TaxID=72664 RepID=V4KI80_EUTSA|nr:hypothetical protein EUTSA_v10024083mg [Eutrema salsugineum]